MPSEGDASKLCFVIGSIGDFGTDIRRHADWLLDAIVKPVFMAHFPHFKVERADEIVSPGSINSQVINRLMDAQLVIADMSHLNANAFYELAIRHMKRLPTIHMIHKSWKIPFDVAPYRAIVFSFDQVDELEAAKVDLKATVEEVAKPEFVVENPVTHARARFEIDEHATPAVKALASEVAALRGAFDQLSSYTDALAFQVQGLGSAPPVGNLLGASMIGERDRMIRALQGPAGPTGGGYFVGVAAPTARRAFHRGCGPTWTRSSSADKRTRRRRLVHRAYGFDVASATRRPANQNHRVFGLRAYPAQHPERGDAPCILSGSGQPKGRLRRSIPAMVWGQFSFCLRAERPQRPGTRRRGPRGDGLGSLLPIPGGVRRPKRQPWIAP
jgi:hypothetical protein